MTKEDKIYDGSKNNDDEKQLPPIASNGDVNLWVDEDKNGDKYLKIEAPFLETENVFIQDDCKKYFNKLVEQWEEDRES